MTLDTDTKKKIVRTFIQSHPLATVATLSSAGTPQTAVVYVYMDDDNNAYFVTKASTRKYTNIGNNDLVSLSFFDEDKVTFSEVVGNAVSLVDVEEMSGVLAKLQDIISSRKSSYWIPPVAQMTGDTYVIVKVIPFQMSYVNYSESTAGEATPEYIDVQSGG